MTEIIIRYVDMPCTCKGYTVTDDNDDYNIYINNSIGIIEQKKTLKHEIQHIKKDHFYSEEPVVFNEIEAIKAL